MVVDRVRISRAYQEEIATPVTGFSEQSNPDRRECRSAGVQLRRAARSHSWEKRGYPGRGNESRSPTSTNRIESEQGRTPLFSDGVDEIHVRLTQKLELDLLMF